MLKRNKEIFGQENQFSRAAAPNQDQAPKGYLANLMNGY